MVLTLWKVRSRYNPQPDLQAEYGAVGNFCTIRLHHKGIFTMNIGNRRYVDGIIDYVDFVDMDVFSVLELNEMLEELGYKKNGLPIFYHFRIPGRTLDIGLIPLGNDKDVHVVCKYARQNYVIDIYTEHGLSRVGNHLMSPSKVEIEQIEDEEIIVEHGNVLQLENIEEDAQNVEPGSPLHNMRILPYVPEVDEGHPQEPYFVDMQQLDESVRVDEGIPQNTNFTNGPDLDEFDPFDGVSHWETGGSSNWDNDGANHWETGGASDEESSDEEMDLVNQSELLYDKDNPLEEPEVDMSAFVSVVDQIDERDPTTIPSNLNFGNEEDELCVIDNEVFDIDGVTLDKRQQLLKDITKPIVCSEGEVHQPAFKLGQTFKTKADVRKVVNLHSIETKRALFWEKNDKERIRIRCKGIVPDLSQCGPWTKNKIKCKTKVVESSNNICPWLLFLSRSSTEVDWMVKSIVADHNCVQSRKIKACTAGFMAKDLAGQLETNPTIPITAVHEDLQKKYGVGFSRMKAFRAKQLAEKYLYGDFEKQYSMLRDYGLELQRCNEGTTFKIEVETAAIYSSETRVFKRVYVCLGCLKLGFKAGMRDFLGFDGAFIKGPYPGQVLSAVGLDSNNGIYPVAYAIVEVESKETWSWFLECLADDLDLNASSNFTFSSDRQKGIIPAIKDLFPNAEHRYCLRHIHQNMRLKWRDTEYRDHLWKIASQTTVMHFRNEMELLRQFDANAHNWLKKIDAEHWSKSHFSGRVKTDCLTNNLCEAFNSKLLKARDKPIITCLEYIREYLMRRHVVVQKEIDKCKLMKCQLTPTATSILDKMKKEATQNTCIFNGKDKTQVTTAAKEQYVVNLTEKTCTCMYWELTGIVCSHVVSAIWDKINHGAKNVPIVEEWVHPIYWTQTWEEIYANKVDPINGRNMWPKSECPTTLTAPAHHTQVGRPKKKRKKSQGEVVPSAGRNLSRKFISVKCGKCGNVGHNARTCKGQGGESSRVPAAAKKAPAKKAPTKKAPTTKAAANKAPTTKAAAKKAPAKKAPAKKKAAKKLF